MIATPYDEYFEKLIVGDRRACRRIVQHLVDEEIPVPDLYLGYFQRSMYQVGDMWERNQLSVATEHIATAITEGLMNLAYPLLFASEQTGKSALVACVSREYHQIGAKMVADYLELSGWNAHFVGANVPNESIVSLIQDKRPDLVCLSVSLQSSLVTMDELIDAIRADSPDLPIVVGGAGFDDGARSKVSDKHGVTHLTTLASLESYLESSHG